MAELAPGSGDVDMGRDSTVDAFFIEPGHGIGHAMEDFRTTTEVFGIDTEHASHGIRKRSALRHEHHFVKNQSML